MGIVELLKSAYAIGGATAVLVAVLIGAVVTLYRRLQEEHEERLKQARHDTDLMRELLESMIDRTNRSSRHDMEELMDYDDDDRSTGLTFLVRENVQKRARDYLHSQRPPR
jgi:hypothetical protein